MSDKYGSTMKNLRTKIYQLRTSSHLTQQQLAEIFHVNHKSISQYENGKTDISVELLLDYCKYFGVSMDFFFEQDDNLEDNRYKLFAPSSEEILLIEDYRKLSIEWKRVIRNTVSLARNSMDNINKNEINKYSGYLVAENNITKNNK